MSILNVLIFWCFRKVNLILENNQAIICLSFTVAISPCDNICKILKIYGNVTFSILQAYGQSFLQPDIAIFKQNLESLEALNAKWKLFHKVIYYCLPCLKQCEIYSSHWAVIKLWTLWMRKIHILTQKWWCAQLLRKSSVGGLMCCFIHVQYKYVVTFQRVQF